MAVVVSLGPAWEKAGCTHVAWRELTALNSRVVIEQARGILAERHDLHTRQAFTAMRFYARHTGQPLKSIASQIIHRDLDPAAVRHA